MFSCCLLENFETLLWCTSHAIVTYAVQVQKLGDLKAALPTVNSIIIEHAEGGSSILPYTSLSHLALISRTLRSDKWVSSNPGVSTSTISIPSLHLSR